MAVRKYVTKEDIVQHVRITDIAKEFGIDLEFAASGNFDLRCKCPSEEHKNGNERTSSCYIDSKNNNFYCFGCGVGSNCIDFYMACMGINFSEAMKALKPRVDLSKVKGKRIEQLPNNFSILLETSALFRKIMISNPKDLKWINNIMKRTDQYLLDIEPTDTKSAQKLYKKLKSLFEKRYGK